MPYRPQLEPATTAERTQMHSGEHRKATPQAVSWELGVVLAARSTGVVKEWVLKTAEPHGPLLEPTSAARSRQACAIGDDWRCRSARTAGPETSSRTQTTANNAQTHGSSSMQASAAPRPRQRQSIATDGSPTARETRESFLFLLSGQLAQRFFGFLDVIHCEFAGFDQTRDHRFDAATEQCQKVVD